MGWNDAGQAAVQVIAVYGFISIVVKGGFSLLRELVDEVLSFSEWLERRRRR